MLKRGVLLIGFLSIFSLSLAQHHEAAAETKPATETKVVSAKEAEKEKAQQNRVISVQIDPQIVVESTSAVGVLFTEIGSATTTPTFSFCKSAKKRSIQVERFGNVTKTSGTC